MLRITTRHQAGTVVLQFFQTENDLAQSETAVSTDLVALHKALGGGWDTFPMPGPTRAAG